MAPAFQLSQREGTCGVHVLSWGHSLLLLLLLAPDSSSCGSGTGGEKVRP